MRGLFSFKYFRLYRGVSQELYTWYGYAVPGIILFRDLVVVKTCQCMFQRAPGTISTH
jgi:hypothetical protein